MRWQDEPWFAVVAGLLGGILFFTLHYTISDNGLVYSLAIGVLWFLGCWFGERRRRLKRRSAHGG